MISADRSPKRPPARAGVSRGQATGAATTGSPDPPNVLAEPLDRKNPANGRHPAPPRLDPLVPRQPAQQRPRRGRGRQGFYEFGFRQPIVIDADDVIVVGHTRFKAALKLGMTEVPVHVAETIGRRAVLELDPRYCDVIVKRWEGFTGRVAERVPGAADVAVPA